jgi:hypothetical protein
MSLMGSIAVNSSNSRLVYTMRVEIKLQQGNRLVSIVIVKIKLQ